MLLLPEVQAEPDDNTGEEETPTYSLSFTVNDGTNPIEGATVTIDDVNKTTGSAGGCTFNDMSSGVYTVEVSKEGYVTKTESITVDETHISFTISLTAE